MNEPLPYGEANLVFNWSKSWRWLTLASVHIRPIREEDSEIS